MKSGFTAKLLRPGVVAEVGEALDGEPAAARTISRTGPCTAMSATSSEMSSMTASPT
jgi:hypothetical protein